MDSDRTIELYPAHDFAAFQFERIGTKLTDGEQSGRQACGVA
jgi:hypothetical protein